MRTPRSSTTSCWSIRLPSSPSRYGDHGAARRLIFLVAFADTHAGEFPSRQASGAGGLEGGRHSAERLRDASRQLRGEPPLWQLCLCGVRAETENNAAANGERRRFFLPEPWLTVVRKTLVQKEREQELTAFATRAESRRHRSGSRWITPCSGIQQALPGRGLRHQPPRASPSCAGGRDRTLEVSPEALRRRRADVQHAIPADLADCNVFIVTVPDADSTPISGRTSALMAASRTVGEAIAKGRRGDLRIHRLSGRTGRGLRAGGGRGLGPDLQPRLLRRLQPRARQPGRPDPPLADIVKVTAGFDAGGRRASSTRSTPRSSRPARTGRAHPRGRGGQGDREHPARPEHRADQRVRLIFQRPGHRHPGGAGGRRHQVELPELPPRPGRRPLHRRRPLLPDPQGRGAGLPPEVILAGRRINDGMGGYVAAQLVKEMTRRGRLGARGCW